MRNSRQSAGGRLGDAAAENPGRAALLSLVSTPLAMKAGRVALRWARRNPGVALAVAAGALAWWGTKAMRENGGAPNAFDPSGSGDGRARDDDGSFDFPGAAHGSVGGYGRDPGAGRSMGGDDSSASSL
jgi:hypothetical protein